MTQGEFFLPHLPRVVSALARRFKDPDSVVTDACVDVVGSASMALGADRAAESQACTFCMIAGTLSS